MLHNTCRFPQHDEGTIFWISSRILLSEVIQITSCLNKKFYLRCHQPYSNKAGGTFSEVLPQRLHFRCLRRFPLIRHRRTVRGILSQSGHISAGIRMRFFPSKRARITRFPRRFPRLRDSAMTSLSFPALIIEHQTDINPGVIFSVAKRPALGRWIR